MGTWMCPNIECAYDKQMRPEEHCPLCGKIAEEFDFKALGALFKEKWDYKEKSEKVKAIKRVLRRTKFCPRCGSTKVFWAHGLPQMWSLWDCKNCGYRGVLIIEDSKVAAKLRKDHERKKKRNRESEKGRLISCQLP